MMASLYLNDKSKTYEDVNDKAHEALSLFIEIDSIEGRAETNFLFGMISKKKMLRKVKSDTLKLKTKANSEMFTKKAIEHEPLMHKGSSITVQIASRDDKTYLDVAKDLFQRMGNLYGVSRVSFAISLRMMEQEIDINDKPQIDEIRRNLKQALKGFNDFRDVPNQISCNLKLSELELALKNNDKAKVFADEANSICVGNKKTFFLAECVNLMTRVNEAIRSNSQNVFVFLKAFPLVDPDDKCHVGPITQKLNNFKAAVMECFQKEKKVLRVKFDVLTRDSLSQIKSHGCRVLHLSSDEAMDIAL